MQRSFVNKIIEEAHEMIRSYGLLLPPFAHWSVEEMRERVPGTRIAEAKLGWDVTDFGSGNFAERGLFLFTVRNGDLNDLRRGTGMCYAEKLLISRKDQMAPLHTHYVKAEDIINRGGATLAVRLFNATPERQVDKTSPVTVLCDGAARTVAAGEVLRIPPGESVTLLPGQFHAFWGEGGDVLIGEVSTVNDDVTDNVFADPIGRFSHIEEDEAPTRLLVSDYDTWLKPA